MRQRPHLVSIAVQPLSTRILARGGQRLMMARARTTLAQASSAPLAEMEAT